MAWRRKPETPCKIVAVGLVAGRDAEECANACPYGALWLEKGRLRLDVERCVVCIACMALCGPERVKVLSDWRCPDEG